MNQHNELIDYAIEQRNETQALVIGVCSRKSRVRRMLREMFSSLGETYSAGGVVPTFAGAGYGADFIITDLRGKNAAETAFNAWIARPHILIIDEPETDALDGMEPGGVVICMADNDAFEEIEEMVRETNCSGLFTIGNDYGCAARVCESLEAGNGTRATFEILGEKVTLKIGAGGDDLTTILFGLLGAAICGYQGGHSSQALAHSLKEQPWRQQGGNLALFEAGRNKSQEKQEAAFKVLAMVDPGRGRRRMAFLSHLDLDNKMDAQLALPMKTDNLDLVYMGNNNQSSAANDARMELGEIVTDVLSPGDILKIRQAFGKGMGTMIEALRTLPEQFMKGSDTGYAV